MLCLPPCHLLVKSSCLCLDFIQLLPKMCIGGGCPRQLDTVGVQRSPGRRMLRSLGLQRRRKCLLSAAERCKRISCCCSGLKCSLKLDLLQS